MKVKVKYQKFEKTWRSYVTVPIKMAEKLGWMKGDEIVAEGKTSRGEDGIFFYKERREGLAKILEEDPELRRRVAKKLQKNVG